MTRKHWLILVLLVVSALYPVLMKGKDTPKVSPKKNHESVEGSKNERAALTNDSKLFAKADQTLSKLSALAELGPVEDKPSADDILKQTQLSTIDFGNAESSVAPTAVPTEEPRVVAKEELVTTQPTEMEATPAPLATFKASTSNEGGDPGNLQLQIATLEAKLQEQKQFYESQNSDLKAKLDVQESDNVKLSHQIQNAENSSADAHKQTSKMRDLEARLEKSKAEVVEERKKAEESATQRIDVSKRLTDEEKVRKSVENQLEAALKKRDEQAKDNEKLKRTVGDFEKRVKQIEEQRLAVSEDKEQVLLKQLASLRKELNTAQTAMDDLKKKQKAQSTEVTSVTGRADTLQKQVEAKQRENDELSVKLATAERINEKSKELQQELISARNELLLAQEQVRTLISTSKNPSPDYQNRTIVQSETIHPPRPTPNARVTPAPGSSDYLTVEVTAPKAALRAGPGEENSTVMEIQQGSRLMVETREGDWFRVITPKGQRAYLRSDLAVELDANGRPRFSPPSAKSISPGPRASRTLNANPPDSDPLVELLGRQLKDRAKAQPKGEALNADEQLPPLPSAPTGSGNGEDEMEAFETLKKGMSKDSAGE